MLPSAGVLVLVMTLGALAAPQEAQRFDPPAGPGAMAPNLVASGAEELLLIWLEPEESPAGKPPSHRLRFARWKAGAWEEAVTITRGEALVANWADFPSVARGANGVLVAHWAERSGKSPYAYDVILGRSTDGGKSWRRHGPAHDDKTPTEHGFVSLLEERAGVRAFWLDGRDTAGAEGHEGHGAGAMTLRTAVLGKSLGAGERLDGRVCDCCGTSAAMTSEGPVVVYRNRDVEEVRDIYVIRRAGKGWSPPRPVHADGWKVPGCPVNGPSVVARGRKVAVAWYTYAEDRPRVRLAFSEDAGASFGAPLEVDGARGGRVPIGRVDVALDEDGAALVSWLAAEREQASLFVRRATADGRMGDALHVVKTQSDRQSGFPRMERLGDSLFVAWTEVGSPSHVRVVRLPVAEVPPASSPAETASGPAGFVEPLAPGQPAPEFAAVDLEGTKVSLAGERGRAVLVNLWATWCEPCRFELPELAALHRRHAEAGLRVIGVSVDAQRTPAEIRDFVRKRELPYAFWHDPKNQSSQAFRVEMLPASFLFDRSGTLVWRRLGTVDAKDPELEAAIQRALAKP
ncbi:redoxin domain-containing protein [Hyalangium rubrum]|uniref:Redoxin domain-containing protein n=1 Tax=Hyalangium rubrum TaxID=3103134 RepID=A0ABU5H3C5_9BACT|nr:redoxin domain-containing protein [Hyalangium sp. s54d21]MDY7227960.1 redoxin domain-containing protein [Hyalangium sp. s54d21]